MAIHIGLPSGGWAGASCCGNMFHPASGLNGRDHRLGLCPVWQTAASRGLLYGVKPVIIEVIVQALWRLSRVAIKTNRLALAGLIGVALNFLGVNELFILFRTGLILVIARSLRQLNFTMPLCGIVPADLLATTSAAITFGL